MRRRFNAAGIRPAKLFACLLIGTGISLGSGCGVISPRGGLGAHLRMIETSVDPNVRYASYAKLVDEVEALDEASRASIAVQLAERLGEEAGEPAASRAMICRALAAAAVAGPEVRESLAAALSPMNDPIVRTEACRALGAIGHPKDLPILARTLVGDPEVACRTAAAEAIARLRGDDPRIEEVLVDAMADRDPAIRLAAVQGLRERTGHDLGLDVANWQKWLEARKARQGALAQGAGSVTGQEAGTASEQIPTIEPAPDSSPDLEPTTSGIQPFPLADFEPDLGPQG